jgi:hypothetical protein
MFLLPRIYLATTDTKCLSGWNPLNRFVDRLYTQHLYPDDYDIRAMIVRFALFFSPDLICLLLIFCVFRVDSRFIN